MSLLALESTVSESGVRYQCTLNIHLLIVGRRSTCMSSMFEETAENFVAYVFHTSVGIQWKKLRKPRACGMIMTCKVLN